MDELIGVDDAIARILECAPLLDAETIPLGRAAGRVLALAVRAREDLPAFNNSTMDGYAVRTQDLSEAAPGRPAALRLRGLSRAGSASRRAVGGGEAVKVMTGSPLPAGANAVVPVEETRARGRARVMIENRPEAWQWIRSRGEDARAGEELLPAGTRLRPLEIAVLASQGLLRVAVRRRPRVALLSTGDELVKPGARPSEGKIRDADGPAAKAALEAWGADVVDLGIAGDDPRALKARLKAGLARADAVVVCGGVSVGDYDFTRPVLAALGVRPLFWKVRLKPGKPFFFGTSEGSGRRKLVFGLPGNPLSVLVCLDEFARPALLKMQGVDARVPPYHLRGRAVNTCALPRERQQRLFCEATLDDEGFKLRLLEPQASHMVARCARANALAAPGVGTQAVKPGDILAFRWLD